MEENAHKNIAGAERSDTNSSRNQSPAWKTPGSSMLVVQEMALLDEAVRVAGRFVVIKDHKPDGFLGFWRVCFLDWAANNPYEVKCLYRYHTRTEWLRMFEERGLVPVAEMTSIDLYPALFNLVFGKRLHYFVVLRKPAGDGYSGPPSISPACSFMR